MTSLATISDQSDIALIPAWILLVAVGVVLLFAVGSIVSLVIKPHGVPVMGDEPSRLDLADKPRCSVPFCDDPVQVNIRAGLDTWLFCLPHGTPYLTREEAS